MDTIIVTILQPEAKEVLDHLESQKKILIEKPKKRDKKPLQFGSMKGLVLYIADDFNAPLDDFKDYM